MLVWDKPTYALRIHISLGLTHLHNASSLAPNGINELGIVVYEQTVPEQGGREGGRVVVTW